MARETYVFDRRAMKLVPAADFYARKFAHVSPAPMIIRDYQEPHVSVLSGKMITSKRQQRDEARAYGVVEVGNEKPREIVKPLSHPGHALSRAYDEVVARHAAKRRPRKRKASA